MREFDEQGLAACVMQGEAFALSRGVLECSSAIFVRRFMRSRAARRLDAGAELASRAAARALLDEAMAEYTDTSYGTDIYGTEELYWMGYLYRYWSYTCEQASRVVHNVCGARELRSLYSALHVLDPTAAIGQICESKGIPVEDSLASGTRILREIRSKADVEYMFVKV